MITMGHESRQSKPGFRVCDFLEGAAASFAAKPAVIHQERRITYGELWEASSRLSMRLKQLNLVPGSRVALLSENSVVYVIAYFAVLLSGMVVVPLDTSLGPDNLASVLDDCDARVLITQQRFQRCLQRALSSGLQLNLVIFDGETAVKGPVQVESFSEILSLNLSVSEPMLRSPDGHDSVDSELAAIFYTSGSSGRPKGVMLSHLNLVSNTRATVEYLGLSIDDSVMVVLPFGYIYGNSLMLTHVAAGGTLVIDNRFMYPEVILDTMEKEKVTGFSGVPSNYMILLDKSTLARRKLSHLRYLTQAGGAMTSEVIHRLIKAVPRKDVYIMYGQTEASPRITYLPPKELTARPGSVGVPVPGVSVKLVDPSGSEVAPGEIGEIVVKGDCVMMGYWNQPYETERVLHDGWLHTGDLARRDEEGYFYIVGRKSDIIKSGGHRISAREIENRILENEKVAEVSVFGIRDDVLGEAIKAVIVLRPGCRSDEKDIQTHCSRGLPVHKVPKFVVFRDIIPRQASGKVDKQALMNQNL